MISTIFNLRMKRIFDSVSKTVSMYRNFKLFNQIEFVNRSLSYKIDAYQIQNDNNYSTNTKGSLIRSFCKNNNSISCWNCQNNKTNKFQYICDSCGMIQDVNKNLDLFQVLSLEKNFNIDSTKLTSTFRQFQNMVHPDKFSTKSEREQTNSQEWSALINKAYKTLLIPIQRGEYLLNLHGITLPKDNSTLNKEFLMEMMERNEEVEDASSKELDELLKRVRYDMDIEANKLDTEFKLNNFDEAKFILIKMKYLTSLEKSIKDKLQKFMEKS